MEKGDIIRMSLYRLGKNNAYNDNKSDEYKVAETLLDHVVSNIAKETAFLFNSVTVELTEYQPSPNVLKEKKFNKPIDLLNLIRSDVPIREEGEFFYSSSSKIVVQYCRKISLQEFPDNLKDLLIYSLCLEMCMAFNSYVERYPIFKQNYEIEKDKIVSNQYNNFFYGGA